MNNEILNAILEIIRQGGSGAMLAVYLYFGYMIVKVLACTGVLLTIISLVYKVIKRITKTEFMNREEAEKFMKGW